MLFAASAMAVTSVNVVGYVNKTVPAGQWAILANPLSASPDNTIATVLPTPPDGTTVYKWDSSVNNWSSDSPNSYDSGFGGWGSPGMTLKPGEGFFLNAPSGADLTITFVGDVLQGAQVVPIGPNYQLVGSTWPATGALQGNLMYSPSTGGGDTVYVWNMAAQGYTQADLYIYDPGFGGWGPSDPVIEMGTGFWLLPGSDGTATWNQNFTVN